MGRWHTAHILVGSWALLPLNERDGSVMVPIGVCEYKSVQEAKVIAAAMPPFGLRPLPGRDALGGEP